MLILTYCKKEICNETNSNCNCSKNYDPVCGLNCKTNGNSCEAECKGITDYKKEKFKLSYYSNNLLHLDIKRIQGLERPK